MMGFASILTAKSGRFALEPSFPILSCNLNLSLKDFYVLFSETSKIMCTLFFLRRKVK